jgi:hypothetical protein
MRAPGEETYCPMTANTSITPAPAAAPAEYTSAQHRFVCDALRLHHFCTLARCRRTRRCHGEPQRCLETHSAAVPRVARDFVEASLVAARYNRACAGMGTQWLNDTKWREATAFNAWAARFEPRD